MFSFLPLINNFVTIGFKSFLITNHMLKDNLHFTVFIWIVFFNIFMNVIHIFEYSKALESFKCFKRVLPRLLSNN